MRIITLEEHYATHALMAGVGKKNKTHSGLFPGGGKDAQPFYWVFELGG